MPKTKKPKQCEYQLPNCQRTADTQISLRLGSVSISKYWACNYCGDIVRKELKLITKWIKLLKNQMLYFTDFRSRDWFLEMLK